MPENRTPLMVVGSSKSSAIDPTPAAGCPEWSAEANLFFRRSQEGLLRAGLRAEKNLSPIGKERGIASVAEPEVINMHALHKVSFYFRFYFSRFAGQSVNRHCAKDYP